MLKENEEYLINGELMKFSVDVERDVYSTLPVAIFTGANKSIIIKYNRLTQTYHYSEPIDIEIEYHYYSWRRKPKD